VQPVPLKRVFFWALYILDGLLDISVVLLRAASEVLQIVRRQRDAHGVQHRE